MYISVDKMLSETHFSNLVVGCASQLDTLVPNRIEFVYKLKAFNLVRKMLLD